MWIWSSFGLEKRKKMFLIFITSNLVIHFTYSHFISLQDSEILIFVSVQLQPWHLTAQWFNQIKFFEQVWGYLFVFVLYFVAGWVRLWVWEQFTPPWLPAVPHLCCQRSLHHLRILLQGASQPLPSDPELKHGQLLCCQMSCHGRSS